MEEAADLQGEKPYAGWWRIPALQLSRLGKTLDAVSDYNSAEGLRAG